MEIGCFAPEMFVAEYIFSRFMFVFDSGSRMYSRASPTQWHRFPPNLLKIVRFCAAFQRDETSIANNR